MAVPIIFDFTKNKIAQPNTSLAEPGKTVKWECADWLTFHKGIVRFFMEGRFQSKIKYSKEAAIANTNQVFLQHWNRNKTAFGNQQWCGYASEFYNYFKSAGLTDVLSYFQAVVVPSATATASVVDTAATTTTKLAASAGQTVVNAGDTIANTTGLAKYVVPALGVAGVALVVTYIYKHYIKEDNRVQVGVTTI